MVTSAIRSTWRPAGDESEQHTRQRDDDRQHQQRGRIGRHGSADGSWRVSAVTGRLEESQQQGNRQGRRGKGDDDSRDDQRLRDRIAAEPGRRAPARDDAEDQEHAAAEQIEGEDLAQRLGIRDQAVEPEPHRDGRAQPEYGRRAHGSALRSGAPAISRPSVTAIVSVIATSIARISGLAYATG